MLKTNDSEFGLSIAAVPFTIAFLFLAAVVTRRESIVGMVVVVVFYLAALAYYIFKLVRIYSPKVTIYSSVRKSLASFAVLAILLIVVTIAYAIICSTNFGKGLKPHIQKKHGAGKNQEPGVENGMGMGVMGGANGMNGQGMHGNGFGGYGGYDPGYGEMGKVPGVTQSQTRMTID